MKFILLVFLLFSLSTQSQIVINPVDMPQPDDVFAFSSGNLTTEDPSLTGEGFSWDFSAITSLTQQVDSFVSIDDTPALYQFFFNNGFIYPDYEADVALEGEDVEIATFNVTDIYNYYKNDEDGYRLVGVGSTLNGLPQSTQYDPIEWIYEFPLNYGNSFDNESYIEYSLPGVGFVSQEKATATTVDGWGVLQLPIGEFEVLRVKKIINQVDSVYNEALGFGLTIPRPEAIEYQWLANGQIEPILSIRVSNNVVGSVRYLDEFFIGIEEFHSRSMSLYPNPALNVVSIISDTPINISRVSVVDGVGKVVAVDIQQEISGILIDVSPLSAGLYFVQIEEDGVVYTQKFLIQ